MPTYVPYRRTVAVFLFITAALTVVYWLLFFFVPEAVRSSDTPEYLAFESAFPAADLWMALAALLAGLGLWRLKSSAMLWSLLAGSALIFLGLMDVLYNLENNMYALGGSEMAIEAVINVWCLAFGSFVIWYAWRHRRAFLSKE
jgi:hypothetical protein